VTFESHEWDNPTKTSEKSGEKKATTETNNLFASQTEHEELFPDDSKPSDPDRSTLASRISSEQPITSTFPLPKSDVEIEDDEFADKMNVEFPEFEADDITNPIQTDTNNGDVDMELTEIQIDALEAGLATVPKDAGDLFDASPLPDITTVTTTLPINTIATATSAIATPIATTGPSTAFTTTTTTAPLPTSTTTIGADIDNDVFPTGDEFFEKLADNQDEKEKEKSKDKDKDSNNNTNDDGNSNSNEKGKEADPIINQTVINNPFTAITNTTNTTGENTANPFDDAVLFGAPSLNNSAQTADDLFSDNNDDPF
ncbi:hypothetical protein RFI_06895, partial [Reticulomyxa filosa]